MRFAALIAILAALGPPAPARGADEDLRALVERLGSPSAAERWRAERELGLGVGVGDLAELAAIVEESGAEVRLRVAAALGARDEHLGLAAALAADLRRRPREVGEWAVASALGRWRPMLSAQPLRGDSLYAALDRKASRQRREEYRIEGRVGLVEAIDELAARARPPVPIVVDPALRGTPVAAPGSWVAVSGSWRDLLEALANTRAVGIDAAFTVDETNPDLAELAYVRLTRPELVGIDPPDAQVVRWLRDAQSRVGPVAARGARALGECGWPAALDWLGERWVADADPAALAGLVVAARRGYLAPALLDPGRYRQLCAALRERCENGAPEPAAVGDPDGGARVEDDPLAHVRPEEVTAALAVSGARLADGSSALAVLLADAAAATPRWTWLALGAAGELGVSDPRLVQVAGQLLSDPLVALDDAAAGALVGGALEAWAAAVGDLPPAPQPARARALLASCDGVERARALLRAILRSGAAAPIDPPGPDVAPLGAALHVAWLLADGRLDLAPAALGDRLRSLDGLAAAARDRQLGELAALVADVALDRPAVVEEVFASLRRDGATESVTRELAARCGRLEPAAHGPALSAALDRRGAAAVDVELLADLAIGPVGPRAQDLLVERLEAEVTDPGLHDPAVPAALARVLRSLLAAERDGEALALRSRVRRTVRADVRTPAAKAVLDRSWPGVPGLEPVLLLPPTPVPEELRRSGPSGPASASDR